MCLLTINLPSTFYDILQKLYPITLILIPLNLAYNALLDKGIANKTPNHLAEQDVRTSVYRFSTSIKRAKTNAMTYTLIETVKANGLNVYRYLTYLLKKHLNRKLLMKPQLLEDFLSGLTLIQDR